MNASADTRAYVADQNGRPVVQERHERHHDRDNYAFEGRDHDHWRRCDAAKWDPNRRYMPGDAVRRKGEVYVATQVSRHVYNVNSPPEWTPNYWAPARCH
jgi:non-ribosomal peptide synthetase component E (peptide arylation enzyme)